MTELTKFRIELYLPETDRRVILGEVEATEYDDALSYGESVAAGMPEEEIWFDKSDRIITVQWQPTVDEVTAPPRRLEFQSGRQYGPGGQLIRAVEDGCDVLMNDYTRGIIYRLKNCPLNPSAILLAYDQGGNDGVPSLEFDRQWDKAEDK